VSYAAEPYLQFVDDLLVALTGGVTREQFLFYPDQAPFRLAPPGPIVKSTLSVYGQALGAYKRFQIDRDFLLAPDNTLSWKARADGTPAPDATWPEEGTPFYVNYDHRGPTGPAPQLSDRNVGSVTRLLAESFAREFAVVSKQLESVYQAGFLDTSTGRDLDQLVALLGLTRRSRSYAAGTVVFARSTPAPADAFIPAGTRLSTAEPPPVSFETTADRTLHRGDLSVEAPIQSMVSGGVGVVAQGTVSVIHRPILGIESATNPQGTQLSGADETDDALRARARRALETSGKATSAAVLGALTTLEALREKDIRIAEDHLARPGVVTVNVAAPLTEAQAIHAVALIEESRPVGVRVIHNLDAPPPLALTTLSVGPDESDPSAQTTGPSGLYFPIAVRALLQPASPSLTSADRNAMKSKAADAVRAFMRDVGIGEKLIYNRLVAGLMGVDGVHDVLLSVHPKPAPGAKPRPGQGNLDPGNSLRAQLLDDDLQVEIAGEIVAFDFTVKVKLTPLAIVDSDTPTALEDARLQIAATLQDRIGTITPPITRAKLLGQIDPTVNFSVTDLSYQVTYVEASLVVNVPNPEITPAELEQAWVRRVQLDGASG
jgi:uncharacterized phage protein gp47/JayE